MDSGSATTCSLRAEDLGGPRPGHRRHQLDRASSSPRREHIRAVGGPRRSLWPRPGADAVTDPGKVTVTVPRRIGSWFSPTGRSSGSLDEGRIEIDPYDPALLQPSSVDVRVDRYFRVFHNARYPFIDVKQPQEELTELVEIDGDNPFILHPGEFVLGSTLERVRLPDDLVARLEGKSSASAGSGCSSTRRPVSSTPAGTATSRWSCRTWPTSRSRSTTG